MGKLRPREGKGFGLDHTKQWGPSWNPTLPMFDVELFLSSMIPASSCLPLAWWPLENQVTSLSLVLHPSNRWQILTAPCKDYTKTK